MASRRGPDNTLRIAISGNFGAGTPNWANVFAARLTTSGSIAQVDLDSWTTSVQAAYKTRFAPRQSTAVAYVLAKTVLYTPGGGELISNIAMTGTGSSAGTLVSDLSACEVVSWLTTVYWRGGKPRTYIPGVVTTAVSASRVLTPGEVTALQTAGAGFRTDVNALAPASITGSSLGFNSFFTGNTLRAPPVFFPFTGATVHPRLGSQRRRLGKWTT
jgi:hypothetical protein